MVAPTDWKEVRLGDLGSTFGGLTGKSSKDFGNGNSSFVTFMNVMSNVVLNNQGTEKVRIGNGERQSQLLEGDVIFNGSSETPEEVGFGSAVPIELSGLYLNSFCFGFRRKDTKSLDPKFFAYLTRSPLGRDIIRPMAQGSTRYNIAKTNLLNGRFPLPPLKEQEAIAEALSDADAAIESIDALIAKKRDVKQATMQQLLTGRTRLPGFTADWEEVRLGDLVSRPITDGPHLTPRFYDDGVPFLSVNNIVDGKILWNELRYISKEDDKVFSVKCKPRRGDILFGKAASVGKIALVDTDLDFNVWSPLAVIRCSSLSSSQFVYFALQTSWTMRQIALLTNSSSQGNIGMTDIAQIKISLPPLKEQEAIAEALTVMDDELEALTEQVSKLRMVKEGMMQDLLTGKVRLV